MRDTLVGESASHSCDPRDVDVYSNVKQTHGVRVIVFPVCLKIKSA